jgi:hypothetical protein
MNQLISSAMEQCMDPSILTQQLVDSLHQQIISQAAAPGGAKGGSKGGGGRGSKAPLGLAQGC